MAAINFDDYGDHPDGGIADSGAELGRRVSCRFVLIAGLQPGAGSFGCAM